MPVDERVAFAWSGPASEARGDGHALNTPESGLGQIFAIASRSTCLPMANRRAVAASVPRVFSSEAFGVRHAEDEESLALLREANFLR